MAESTMICPKCNTAMSPMTMVGTTIDICPMCNGCWLDSEELTQLTRSRGTNAVRLEVVNKKPHALVCPRCRKATLLEGQHHLRPDFFIDQCDRCGGIWLDRGELPTLLSTR